MFIYDAVNSGDNSCVLLTRLKLRWCAYVCERDFYLLAEDELGVKDVVKNTLPLKVLFLREKLYKACNRI